MASRRLARLSERYEINIDDAVFNSVYLPYLMKVYHFEVYYGGSGSGKSTFIGQKLPLQLTLQAGRNMVAVRKQKTDCRDSCYPEIKTGMKSLGLMDFWKVVEHPNVEMTNRINGNKIIFGGMDDVENIKSIKFDNQDSETGIGGNLTDIWYEEATEEGDVETIRELVRRMRDLHLKCRLVLSFNPIYATHWIKKYIEEELRGKDALILKTTYKDNRFLPDWYCKDLESQKGHDPYGYMVYALGEWGITGKSVFDMNKLRDRLILLEDRYSKKAPLSYGFSYDENKDGYPVPDSFKPYEMDGGDTLVFSKPQPRVPYVLAFDTAGEGSDRYAAHVRDNRTGEQVARYLSDANPDECVLQIYGLAKWYNEALVAPEANFDSYPIKKLVELGYTNFYYRDLEPDSYGGSPPTKIGFLTTSGNRQRILSELVEWVSINIDKINDIDTLNEMMTFTRQARKQKGIFWSAAEGAHDDLVMSFAILLQAAEQQSADAIPENKPLEGTWLQGELEMAYEEGRITYEEMERFKKTSGYIGDRDTDIFDGLGGLYDY